MGNFSLILALLCNLSWVAASASLFQTVTVRPDEEVTLRCANLSRIAGHIFWFKLADGPDASRISSMSTSEAVPLLHGEFQRGKFTMRSNVTNIFLDIRQVEVNDSGLYFCGFYAEDFPGVFAATYLHVEGRVRLSLCRFHSVTVQAGGRVTLSCTNLSNHPSHISWSKLADGGIVGCILSMTSSESRAVPCDGGQSNKYNMTSNGTNVFLHVQEVNLLDAGVYICGLPTDEFTGIFGVTYLQVEGDSNCVSHNLSILILGSVVVFLLVNLNSEAVSYSALDFRSKANGDRRPTAERETDPHFHTAVAQPGEEVTLRCSNRSTYRSQVFWFKLDDGPLGCISSMLNAESAPSSYDPFQPDKFAMTSDSANVSLRIRPLDVNDSGLYFCGHYFDGFPAVFTATYLKVEGMSVDSFEEPDGPEHMLNWILGGIIIFLIIVIVGFIVKVRTLYADGLDGVNLPTVILGGVVFFLVIIILGLVLKTKPCHTGQTNRQNQQHTENLDSDSVNYAALNFRPKANR
ncbi:hypothetical protein CCH79_00019001, partial [Gambusia affinis]